MDVFNNLSKALEEVAKTLTDIKKNKDTTKSPIVDSLGNLNISEQLKSIDKGIKEIQKDNKDIIKNQKNILTGIQKEKSKTHSPIDQTVDRRNQNSIKDGVKMILLIAGGVLAVGLAFKVIGTVDFKSVLSLSLAMPLVAIAFEKISKSKATIRELADSSTGLVLMAGAMVAVSKIFQYISPIGFDKIVTISLLTIAFIGISESMMKITSGLKDINTRDLWKLPLVLIAASSAITLSSWILQYVNPVSIPQLLTTVFIAGAFAVLSYSIHKMAVGIKDVNAKDLWKLPLVLVAASLAITVSSYILRGVQPVGLSQLFTTILIAGAFAVLSFGIGKIVQSVGKIDPKGIIMLPLVLIGASAAIMYSSHLLSKVTPISPIQALTSIFIAATFVVLSYGLPKIAEAVDKVSPAQAILMPLILVELAAAIAISSAILSKVTIIPLATLINIAEQAILLTVIGVVMSAGIWLMNKMGVTIGMIAQGSASLIMISGAIMTSSLLLSNGAYDKYPSLSWTLDTSISILAFGVLAALGGELLPEIALGSIGILLIATTIMTSSFILGAGSYDKYPDLSWSIGVGTSMLAFGISMALIGTIVLGTGGIGLAALVLGGIGVLMIASTIVGSSLILNKGNYNLYPNMNWVKSVGLSIIEFGVAMGVSGLMLPSILLGKLAIPMIAESILDVDGILSKGSFRGGPSIGWATGTGILMSVFGMAMMGLGTFIGGTLGLGYLALKAGSKAINLVAQSIVDAASILSTGRFTGGPSVQWAEGVGRSISAFAPVYENLSKGGLFSIFSGGVKSSDMSNAITTIANGIVTAANYFNGSNVFNGGPSKEWSEGVGGAISAFAPVLDNLNKGGIFSIFKGGLTTDDMKSAIISISEGIVSAANFFNGSRASFTGGPTKDWADGISGAISAFAPVIDNLDKGGIFGIFKGGLDSDDMKSAIISISESIALSSLALSKGIYQAIPEDYMKNLSSNVKQYVDLINFLKGSSVNQKILGITISRTSEISKMADDYNKLADSIRKLSNSVKTLDLEKIVALKTFTGSIVLMSLMDTDQFEKMMSTLESKAKVFVDVANDIADGTNQSGVSVKTAIGVGNSGPDLNELLGVMNRMDAKLGQISSSSSNMSQYFNELRTNNIKSKKRV